MISRKTRVMNGVRAKKRQYCLSLGPCSGINRAS
ncbi:MAG: hypothetical protein ACI9DO_001039 [Reinekea sp.]|jgi:hypothetical protein